MAEWNNHESSEVETLRKTIIAQSQTIDALKLSITELNEQLYDCYKHIKKDNEESKQLEFIYW